MYEAELGKEMVGELAQSREFFILEQRTRHLKLICILVKPTPGAVSASVTSRKGGVCERKCSLRQPVARAGDEVKQLRDRVEEVQHLDYNNHHHIKKQST